MIRSLTLSNWLPRGVRIICSGKNDARPRISLKNLKGLSNYMKIIGILLFLIGGLALAVGLVVCVVTLTDDYASSACSQAARDDGAIRAARTRCGADSDCFRRSTVGLTTQDECDSRTSFMNRQLVMGIVPAVIGGFLAFVGLLLTIFGFIRARKSPRATGMP